MEDYEARLRALEERVAIAEAAVARMNVILLAFSSLDLAPLYPGVTTPFHRQKRKKEPK